MTATTRHEKRAVAEPFSCDQDSSKGRLRPPSNGPAGHEHTWRARYLSYQNHIDGEGGQKEEDTRSRWSKEANLRVESQRARMTSNTSSRTLSRPAAAASSSFGLMSRLITTIMRSAPTQQPRHLQRPQLSPSILRQPHDVMHQQVSTQCSSTKRRSFALALLSTSPFTTTACTSSTSPYSLSVLRSSPLVRSPAAFVRQAAPVSSWLATRQKERRGAPRLELLRPLPSSLAIRRSALVKPPASLPAARPFLDLLIT